MEGCASPGTAEPISVQGRLPSCTLVAPSSDPPTLLLPRQGLSTSVYVEPHKDAVLQWDDALNGVRTVLESWLEVQAKWEQLAPLFGPTGLSGQLLVENRKFQEVGYGVHAAVFKGFLPGGVYTHCVVMLYFILTLPPPLRCRTSPSTSLSTSSPLVPAGDAVVARRGGRCHGAPQAERAAESVPLATRDAEGAGQGARGHLQGQDGEWEQGAGREEGARLQSLLDLYFFCPCGPSLTLLTPPYASSLTQGVMEFLEEKRANFPRFYFLSNNEMVDVLVRSHDPISVEPYLQVGGQLGTVGGWCLPLSHNRLQPTPTD